MTPQSMHTTVHHLLSAGLLAAEEPLRRGRTGPLRVTGRGARTLTRALDVLRALDEALGLESLHTVPIVEAVRRAAEDERLR